MGQLLSRIKGEIRQAMLDKDDIKKNVLRVVVGEVERKFGADSDEDVIRAIKKVIEGNVESLSHTGGDTVMIRSEAEIDPRFAVLHKENEILGEYLPKLATPEEIESLLSAARDAIRGAKNDGAATGIAMKTLKESGKAVDGKDVKTVVLKIRSE